MSYDFALINPADREEVYSQNYTYNVAPMLYGSAEAAGRGEFRTMEGKSAAEASIILTGMIEELEANPAKYEAMNPANGWGSYRTLIPVLHDMLTAMRQNPEAVFEIN